ncbi:MAG: glycosyltransferase family 1 protein [Bacteroidia bacterium]|nr:glycosyltransferase family 1 protein [Bacteroidia bacterium]
MRVGWDVFSFDAPGANYGVGPGLVVWRLLPELARLAPDIEFVAFANPQCAPYLPAAPNVRVVVSPYPTRPRPLRLLHEQLWLPQAARREKLDLLHGFGNNLPWGLRIPTVLLVHDLMWRYYLGRGDRSLKYRYFALTVPRSLRRARALVAVSEATRQELIAAGCAPGTVHRIYNGPGSYWEAPTPSHAAELKAKYPERFLLSLTTSLPHKNLVGLLAALVLLRDRYGLAVPLVVAGQLKGRFHLQTQAFVAAHGLEGLVRQVGFVSEAEKTWLYRHAAGVVYPSLYEGFGLPVLEALEAGVPVATSQAASMPEVGGDAALYFDPTRPESIAQALHRLLTDDALRAECIERGRAQAARFSWAQAAAENLALYRQLVGQPVR